MREVLTAVKVGLAATMVACSALLALPSQRAFAAATPTLLRAEGTAPSGPPGATVGYRFSWDYADCASNSKEADPKGLRIVLAWDDSATTPIGFASVKTSAVAGECDGTVTGTVPANATAGDHFPQAYLEDPGRGDEVVPNSNTGKVFAGQQFTVVLPSTPTPAPTPSPSPTDTPLATDTPSAAADTPLPSASSSAASTAPVTGGGRSSGPPTALLAGLGVVILLLAAVAATTVRRRRRTRTAAADPFEFLR